MKTYSENILLNGKKKVDLLKRTHSELLQLLVSDTWIHMTIHIYLLHTVLYG